MTAKARIGFVGLGPMGRDLISATLDNPRASVAAVCDIDEEAIQATRDIIRGPVAEFKDYRALLAGGGLDGIVIAAPNHYHAEITVASLEAGYHTFCEKPMALNVTQCEQMIAAAKKAGKGLMIGQVLRYIGPYRFVLELVRSGDLGKPNAMRTIRAMGRWGSWKRPWRLTRKTVGGMLFEVNVHEIDLMLCILGKPKSVSALGGKFVNDEVDYEDFITAQIQFEGGGIGNVTSACCDDLGKNSGEIYLERGTIYYEGLSSKVHIGRKGKDRQEIPYKEIHPEWETGTHREMREFAEACLGEQPVTIPGEEGMQAVEVCQATYLSAREKRPVEFPLPRD